MTLRHTYAPCSPAGLILPVIGALARHTQPAPPQRYASPVRNDPLPAAKPIRAGAIHHRQQMPPPTLESADVVSFQSKTRQSR